VDLVGGAGSVYSAVANQAKVIRSDGTAGYADMPLISTKAWGAKFDNTTDDTAAVQAAINQAATNYASNGMPQGIELSQGICYLNSSTAGGLQVPRNCPLTVEGKGSHATRIKLSTNTPRAFDFSAQQIQSSSVTATTAAGSTAVTVTAGSQTNFQNGMLVTHPDIPLGTTLLSGAGTTSWTLSAPATTSVTGATLTCSDLFSRLAFRGFTVDANNVQSKDAVVLGASEGGTQRYYVNGDRITFNDVITENTPSVVSTGDYTQANSARAAISIVCRHHNYGEALRSILTNINAQHCNFGGGDTGMLVSAGGGQAIQTGTTNQLTSLAASASSGTGNSVGYAYYRLVALDSTGHPCYPSAEAFCLMSGSNLQASLSWAIPGGSSISSIIIYKGATPGWYTENQAVASTATTFTDAGTGWTAGGLQGPAFAINCFCDKIWAIDCEHDVDPQHANIPTSYARGAGFQFGARGYGGRMGCIRCRVPHGAVDDAYELDGHSYGLIYGCDSVDAINDCGVYINSFSWPIAPQYTRIEKHRTRYTYQGTLTSTPVGIKLSGEGGGCPLHRVRIAQSTHTSLCPDLNSIRAISVLTTAVHRLEIDDFEVEAPAISLSAAATTIRAIYIGASMNAGESSVVSRLCFKNVRTTITGDTNGNTTAGIAGIGLGTGTFHLDGWKDIRPGFNLRGASTHSISGIDFSTASNTITEGEIDSFKPSLYGETGPYAWHLSNSFTVISLRLRISNANFSEIEGSSSPAYVNAANYIGKIFHDGGFIPQGGVYPIAPYTITAPASTTYQQHAEGLPGKLYISGGTGTAINFSRDDSHIFNILTQSSGTFPGTVIDIEAGDWYAITYTAAPTITFAPARK
jgi:hypothetical protein